MIAITRPVSPSLAHCELTHLAREPIDVARAIGQHAAYERLLVSLGARLVRVSPAPDQPDAVFVEDVAVVLDEVAIITRPGAASRRGESAAVAAAVEGYRPLAWIKAPATLDGGDVLRLGRTLYVGRSSRSNEEGVEALRRLVEPHGYRVVEVAIMGCLHLKSAVTAIADAAVLLNPAWVSPAAFPGCEVVSVDDREPGAANVLRLGGTLVHPAHGPRTADRLRARGFEVAPIECDELAKAEGGVTCCSLVFDAAVRT